MKLKQFFPASGPLQLEVFEVLQSTLLAIEILVLVKTTYPFKQMCKQKRVNVFFSLISGYYSVFCSRSLHSLSSKPCYSLINPFSISARKQRDFSLYKSSNLLSACQSVANLYNSWLCVTLLVKNIFFIKICSVFWGWIFSLVSPSSVAGKWRSNHLLGLPGESWPWQHGSVCMEQGPWVTGSWGGLLKHIWSLILCTMHRREFSLWLHSCFWHPSVISGDKRIMEWISS